MYVLFHNCVNTTDWCCGIAHDQFPDFSCILEQSSLWFGQKVAGELLVAVKRWEIPQVLIPWGASQFVAAKEKGVTRFLQPAPEWSKRSSAFATF